MSADNVAPIRPGSEPPPVPPPQFDDLIDRLGLLAAQCAICASAAWAISEDSEGTRPQQTIAAMPRMLDDMREELERLAGELDMLL